MASHQSQRPQFYEGQYLGAEDLQALTQYYRSGDARHALGAHTWGIANGLQLIEKDVPGGIDVYLTPGYAWDGFGRPIVVLAPYKIPAELFKSIVHDTTLDEPNGRLVKLWLRYEEIQARRPAPGFEQCEGDGFSRVQETFRVEIGERSINERQGSVLVGAVSALARDIPSKLGMPPSVLYDESVPFQQFPDDTTAARWLIPIGYVRWKPNANPLLAGAVVKRDQNDLTLSRKLRWSIGVVAETLRPVEDILRVQRRGQDPAPKRWSNDLAWVEGDLRIDGKLNLCDTAVGNLKWQVDGTTANLTIGEANATGQADPRVTIKTGGNVGIGTTTPRNPLAIRATGLWEELLSFEDPSGTTKWHINQKVNGVTPGFNIAETAVADGRLFIQAGGNVGIGTVAPADTLDVAGNLRILANPLRFTSEWSGFPDSTSNQAEISNDTNVYKTLMIVGNKSAGGERRVGIWDRLDVAGAISAGGSEIYFTNLNHVHTGIGNAAGCAAIENSSNYNTLMILGRTVSTTPLRRSVSIWDELNVQGDLTVTGRLTGDLNQLRSTNGEYRLVMQDDGKLRLYHNSAYKLVATIA